MKQALIAIARVLAGLIFIVFAVGLYDLSVRYVAADDEAGEVTFTISDANTDLIGDWKPQEYSDVSIGTTKGDVELNLLGLKECTREEIEDLATFFRIALEMHLLKTKTDYWPDINPKILDILVERLISPKLIKEKPNE